MMIEAPTYVIYSNNAAYQDIARDWAIEAMPTFMFLRDGKIIDKVVGAKKEELQMAVAKHAAA